MKLNDKSGMKGWTVIKLFDASGKERKLFKVNSLWSNFHKLTGLDLKIPFLFGSWGFGGIKLNTVTNLGRQVCAQQLGGTTTTPCTAIAIGIGSPSTTALGSEITTGGGARGAAAVTNITTTNTGDTEQWVKTFTFTLSFAITEEGLFDNNSSGGNLVASQSFSAVNVVNTDTLQVTHKIQET